MSIDPQLIRSSLTRVAEREPEFVAAFYQRLFGRYPQVRPLFSRHTPERQQAMLRGAILAAVGHLEDPDWLTRELGVMGERHFDYGVSDEMYAWVGECLLDTLAEAAGEEWDQAQHDAWAAVYGVMRDLMLAGTARARAQAA